jgi:hypothetical protein
VARADPKARARTGRGAALYVVNRAALLRQALVDPNDNVFDNIPMDGFSRLSFTAYYSLYVRC